METVNHECYVSLEVAKLLKEAGFDWYTSSKYAICDVHERWYDDYRERTIDIEHNEGWFVNLGEYREVNEYEVSPKENLLSAPTLDVAQRWLRNTQKHHVEVSCAEEKGYLPIYFLYKTNITQNFVFYPTYEEAQEAGIKKCLTILLEEKK